MKGERSKEEPVVHEVAHAVGSGGGEVLWQGVEVVLHNLLLRVHRLGRRQHWLRQHGSHNRSQHWALLTSLLVRSAPLLLGAALHGRHLRHWGGSYRWHWPAC